MCKKKLKPLDIFSMDGYSR